MKALLINPYCIVPEGWIPYFPREPLALEYLAAMVKDEHKVKIFDCIGEHWLKNVSYGDRVRVGCSDEEISDIIKSYRPDVVGVTLSFVTQLSAVNNIINLVKKIDKGIVTIVGGNPPSAFPEKMLRENPNVDIIVIGEGELTFKELLDNGLENLFKIDGIAYRTCDGKIKRNNPRKLISNLDSIPFPDRDAVSFPVYSKPFRLNLAEIVKLALKRRLSSVVRNSFGATQLLVKRIVHARMRVLLHGNVTSILTSRGCPFNCYYCCVHNVWSHSYRMRSPKNVLEEIELLHEKYNVTNFHIMDDNFNVSKKRVQEICRGIIERGLDISLAASSGVYLNTLDEETLSLMKKAGFHELDFGIESGNQEILRKVMNKNVDLDYVDTVAKICKRLGIFTGGFFMIGVPGETPKTMEDTVNFAAKCDLDKVRLYVCQPFPGSRMYEDCVKNKWFADDFKPEKALIFSNKSFIKTEEFCPDDVQRIAETGKGLLKKLGKLDMPLLVYGIPYRHLSLSGGLFQKIFLGPHILGLLLLSVCIILLCKHQLGKRVCQ